MADAKRVRVHKLLANGLDLNISNITENSEGVYCAPTEKWRLVALCGIYQELRTLNKLLACPNFLGMPKTLRDIKRCVDRIPTIARPRKRKAKK